MAEQRWTMRICPICKGDRVQLAHGGCADECRNEDGIVPLMVEVEVVPATDRDALYEVATAEKERRKAAERRFTQLRDAVREHKEPCAHGDLGGCQRLYAVLDRLDETS